MAISPKYKAALFNALTKPSRYLYGTVTLRVFRLPFNLVFKRGRESVANEGAALAFLATLHTIRIPYLVDSFSYGDRSYLVTTWEGDHMVGEIWDTLNVNDKALIYEDLQFQLQSLRQQTLEKGPGEMCTFSGYPIADPRLPGADTPRTYATCLEFSNDVWPERNLVSKPEVHSVLKPLINRKFPVVFTQGDLALRNVILPSGRAEDGVCILDWEMLGWMPSYWEVLKATWMEYKKDSEWAMAVHQIFPDYVDVLDLDWIFRSQVNVTMIL